MKTNLPEKVYKYRVWENGSHKNMLLYNELYLASPKDFNDPFDCRIAPDFINLSEKEKNDYINDLLISKYRDIEGQGLNLKLVIKDIERRLNNRENFQREAEEVIFDALDKYIGILSLSIRWDSILMWSHYSSCHRGFCVGFWEEKLRNTGFFGKAGIVHYDTEFPALKPMVPKQPDDLVDMTFTQTYTKSCEWTYEAEYRLVQNFFPKVPKPFERIVNFNNDVFAEVTLGINISEQDSNEIINICRLKKTPVYKAIKKSSKFQIDRVLIK